MITILVADDNPMDVQVIEECLREVGFHHHLLHASSLKRSFELLEDNHIDLIILSLSLEDARGFNSLKRFLQYPLESPIVVNTGLKNDIVAMQSIKAGAEDYLVKGEYTAREFAYRIRFAMIRYRRNFKSTDIRDAIPMIPPILDSGLS